MSFLKRLWTRLKIDHHAAMEQGALEELASWRQLHRQLPEDIKRAAAEAKHHATQAALLRRELL